MMWRTQHSAAVRRKWLLLLLVWAAVTAAFVPSPPPRGLPVLSAAGPSDREREIRRKIAHLKKQGRLNKKSSDKEDDDSDYESRIRAKLGDAKSKLLGFGGGSDTDDDDDDDESEGPLVSSGTTREARIGSLTPPSSESSRPALENEDDVVDRTPIIDPTLFEDDDKDETDLSEEELVDLVALKWAEKRQREAQEREERLRAKARELQAERQVAEQLTRERAAGASSASSQLTSGVGGNWNRNETAEIETYQPKTGSWGAFPRPKDISKAYGGGRRIGPGFSDEQARQQSEEDTRARLQRYREKVGIEVQSEKENAEVIDEALAIASRAMQRGVYSTAVSALEKVTRYCSTNSKVGGKVFLELAMAYEAVGRSSEAITVYRQLSTSRIEEIKINAKRLLYGIEAMQFMRDDVKAQEFSRKKVKSTFIDTTGMDNFAQHFDNVYQTAYIDLEGSVYKRLTESVVRSAREARQILLKATDAGEISRLRVVQALRSLSRHFEDALQKEIAASVVQEPVAVMNGKPILAEPQQDYSVAQIPSPDDFLLADAQSMVDNLNGEWRLQLLADKRGDGVKYFNSTLSWQQVDTTSMTYSASGPSGFLTFDQTGNIEFNEKRRILRRRRVEESGTASVFTSFFGTRTGPASVVSAPQQVISVDSVMLITRGVPNRRRRDTDDDKDYFAVWRRVEPGTFSSSRR